MKFIFSVLTALGILVQSVCAYSQTPSNSDGNWEEFVDDASLGKAEPEWEPWSPYRVFLGLGLTLPTTFKFNVQSVSTDGNLKINNSSALTGSVQVLATIDQHLSFMAGMGLTTLHSNNFKSEINGIETKYSGTSSLDILDLNLGLAFEWSRLLVTGGVLYPFVTKRSEAYASLKGHLSSKVSLGYFISKNLLLHIDSRFFTFTQDANYQNLKIHGRAKIYPVMSVGLQYVF